MAGKQRREGGGAESSSKIFGAQVRLKRVQMGFHTQQALAEQMGFAAHGTIAQIEMGNVAANFDVACRLASFLGISLDQLLGLPAAPAAREWYSDLLMLRLPPQVTCLWSTEAHREMVVQALEALVRVMRENRPEGYEGRGGQGGPREG